MRFIVQTEIPGTPTYWVFDSQWPDARAAEYRSCELRLLGVTVRVTEIALVRQFPVAV